MSSGQPVYWTFETLYLHLGSRLEDIEKRAEQHFALSEQRFRAEAETLGAAISAVERSTNIALQQAKEERQKAEGAADKSAAATNELRNVIQELLRSSISRKEIEERDRVTSDKLTDIITRVSRIEQRGEGLKLGWGILLAIISSIGVIGGLILTIHKW